MINKRELPIYIAMLVLACGFVWLLYAFKATQPKITWIINSITAQEEAVSIGQDFSWVIDVCRYEAKEYVAVNYLRSKEDGEAVLINRVDDLRVGKGECKKIEQKGRVPFHAKPGESQILTRFTVRDTPNELYPPVESLSNTIIIKE